MTLVSVKMVTYLSTKLEMIVTSTALYRSAVAYLALGLAAGLYYRTLTHSQDFDGVTVLSLAHTHFLALGFLLSLILLLLVRTVSMPATGMTRAAAWTYHTGMALTAGMFLFKGTGEVLGWWVDRPMWAGISGTGHILLTVAFALVMISLGRALRSTPAQLDPA